MYATQKQKISSKSYISLECEPSGVIWIEGKMLRSMHNWSELCITLKNEMIGLLSVQTHAVTGNTKRLSLILSLCFSRREWDAASMVIFRCHTDLYKSFSLVDVASRWLSFFLLQLFHMTNSIVNYCVLAQNTDVICKNFHHHIVFVLTQLNSYWARYMVSNSYTDSCTHPSNIRHIPFEPFALWGKFVIGNSELDAVICE